MSDIKPARRRTPHEFRSLPVREWPEALRTAWEEACRPGIRLKPGGKASYLKEVSRNDYTNRCGAFLGFLQRTGKLDLPGSAAPLVTPSNVERYIAELKVRLSSGALWNAISKLRRAAELLDPKHGRSLAFRDR
jgi:hypothetical protein